MYMKHLMQNNAVCPNLSKLDTLNPWADQRCPDPHYNKFLNHQNVCVYFCMISSG